MLNIRLNNQIEYRKVLREIIIQQLGEFFSLALGTILATDIGIITISKELE